MRLELQDRAGWNSWFVWYPVVVGGCLVWLETIERKWNPEANLTGDFSGYAFPSGDWEYRSIAHAN